MDFVLDWESALPIEELELSENHSDVADVALNLGTSMQVRVGMQQ